MLGTGSFLHWPQLFPLPWRTGATFVHDWLALGLFLAIAGHVAMVVTHPGSLRGMLTGRVRRGWATRHHPRWAAPPATVTARTGVVVRSRAAPLLAVAAGSAVVAAATTLLPLLAPAGRGDEPGMVAGGSSGPSSGTISSRPTTS